jgi:hypothetical protein
VDQVCTNSANCPYLFAYKLIDATTGLDFTPDPTYFEAQVTSFKNTWDVATNSYAV